MDKSKHMYSAYNGSGTLHNTCSYKYKQRHLSLTATYEEVLLLSPFYNTGLKPRRDPSPADLPDPGISCIAGGFFTSWASREASNLSSVIIQQVVETGLEPRQLTPATPNITLFYLVVATSIHTRVQQPRNRHWRSVNIRFHLMFRVTELVLWTTSMTQQGLW